MNIDFLCNDFLSAYHFNNVAAIYIQVHFVQTLIQGEGGNQLSGDRINKGIAGIVFIQVDENGMISGINIRSGRMLFIDSHRAEPEDEAGIVLTGFGAKCIGLILEIGYDPVFRIFQENLGKLSEPAT